MKLLNTVYTPLMGQVKNFPKTNNMDCHFCHGEGDKVQIVGDEEFRVPCLGCKGTGKDDYELYLIMNNRMKPPLDGCGTTETEVG